MISRARVLFATAFVLLVSQGLSRAAEESIEVKIVGTLIQRGEHLMIVTLRNQFEFALNFGTGPLSGLEKVQAMHLAGRQPPVQVRVFGKIYDRTITVKQNSLGQNIQEMAPVIRVSDLQQQVGTAFPFPFPFANRKLHLVIVADTDDARIGTSVESDANNISKLFIENVPAQNLSVTKIVGRDVTQANIMAKLAAIPANRNDAIVFAYAGHGAYDMTPATPPPGSVLVTARSDSTRGHVLTLNHGSDKNARYLYRSKIQQQLLGKFGLVFIWTDCCANVFGGTARPRSAALAAKTITPAFDSLFFRTNGYVDLVTSDYTKDESAFGGNEGGFATLALCNYMRTNAQRQLTWTGLFQNVKTDTAKSYQQFAEDMRNNGNPVAQQSQTLFSFANSVTPIGGNRIQPTTPVSGKPKFGVTVVAEPSGLRITKVFPDSPAAKSVFVTINGKEVQGGFDVGDILTHINGVPIKTEAEYAQQVDASGTTMYVTFRNTKTGTVYKSRVMLRR